MGRTNKILADQSITSGRRVAAVCGRRAEAVAGVLTRSAVRSAPAAAKLPREISINPAERPAPRSQ
jgi:hypothetical protein